MSVPLAMTLVTVAVSTVLTQSPRATEQLRQPASRPEALAGPWEIGDPSAVDGIFVMISGSQARAQSIQVRVYHRKPGRGSAGWYSIPDTPAAIFDGTTLRLLG